MYDPNELEQGEVVVSEGEIPVELLDELATEVSQGAWPEGWYTATVIEGYQARNGKQIVTGNALSKNGDSTNLTICFNVQGRGETRNLNALLNHHPEDFTPARMAVIKAAREEFKGVQGAWPGAAVALQSSSLSVGRISQFRKATGVNLTLVYGKINPRPFIGKQIDIRLVHRANENGQIFNDVKEFAPLGSKTSKK